MKTLSLFRCAAMSFLISAPAFAQVTAMPIYQNLGTVTPPQQRSANVVFINNTPLPISNFNVYCQGDLSDFSCSSTCFSLSAYGSCNVFVTFQPRSSTGQLKTLTLQGNGPGVFTQAQISAMSGQAFLISNE